MSLLLYVNGTNGDAERLRHAVEHGGTGHCIEICEGKSSLIGRLRMRKFDLDIVILHAASRTDLDEILSIRQLLDDLRTILILPDRDHDTIAQGLTLRPRYLSFTDGDFGDVSAVLAKMLRFSRKGSENRPASI
jgi:hypothetical protein